MKKPAWSTGARTGPVRNFMDLKIFACEGLICIIDEREGKQDDFTAIPPGELEQRAKAVTRLYRGQTPAQMTKWQRQEHHKRVSGASNCAECAKEARDMGDPTDPQVQAFWAKQRRNVSISFAPKTDAAGYPRLPDLPKGNFTGRTTDPGVPVIHPPPKKRQRSGLILF